MAYTNFGVYIANNTPQNYRARFNAVSNLSWSVGTSLGTFLISRYAGYLGIEAVWPLTFFLGLLGSAGMYLLKIKTEKAVAIDVRQNGVSEQ
ncbi:MAG TPA: MFS transporter, partial [Bacillota bacterium]|nr:MFS transporter [Bacillota bacterium]